MAEIALLNDQDAKNLWDNLSLLETPEEKTKAKGLLTSYIDNKEKLNEPLFMPSKQQLFNDNQNVESMFGDITNIGAKFSDEQNRNLRKSVRMLPDKDAANARIANTQWLANEYRISPQRANEQYQMLRRAYAQKQFGDDQVEISDTDFYNRVGGVIEGRKKQRGFIDTATSSAYKSAALGIPQNQAYADTINRLMQMDGFNGKTGDVHHEAFNQAYATATEQLGKHRETADKLFNFMGASLGAEGIESDLTEEDVLKIVDKIPREDIDDIFYIIRAMAEVREQGDEKDGFFGSLQKSGELLFRGTKAVAGNLKGFMTESVLLSRSQGNFDIIRIEFDQQKFDTEEERLDRMVGFADMGFSEETQRKTGAQFPPGFRFMTESEKKEVQQHATKLLKRKDIATRLNRLAEIPDQCSRRPFEPLQTY